MQVGGAPGGQTGPAERSRPTGEAPLPSPRPAWVVVLGGVMLLFAFHLFLGGLSGLGGVGRTTAASAGQEGAPLVPGVDPALTALRQALMEAAARLDGTHLRAHAAAQMALAIVLLFAVSAIATNDRRGRPASLAAAWVGIAYHLGSALFFVFVVRAGLLASPGWVDEAVALHGAPDPARLRQELLSSASTLLLLLPLTVSLLGIGFSLIVMRYFGGPRGRAFYGVLAIEVPGQPQPRG
jgi:hypothetical protein